MNHWLNFFNKKFLGNTVEDYAWFVGMLLFAVLFQKIISKWLSNLVFRLIKKYTEGVTSEKLFELLYQPISLTFLLMIAYAGASHIEFPDQWNLAPPDQFGLNMLLERGYLCIMLIAFTWIFLRLVDFAGLILLKRAEKTESRQDDQLIAFAKEFVKIIVVIFGFFVILGAVFKLDIGALVAGLGIGGLALALAAKESLENLLASFTIFLDQPFVVGDFVQIGSVIGVVEKVGFRSTRIRTLEKSYLTLPNKKMVDSELDNLSLRTFRRARFEIGVVYETTPEQIKAIVADIQLFIDEHPNTNQEGRVRFLEFGSSSLNIMVQYFVDTMDWDIYIEIKEEINYKIMEIVKKHGSDFAFPTTTVYLHPNN